MLHMLYEVLTAHGNSTQTDPALYATLLATLCARLRNSPNAWRRPLFP